MMEEESYSACSKHLTDDEKTLLEKQDSRLVTPFQSKKLESEAKKYWDVFYKRNENRFFKDRHWIMREFPELEGFEKMPILPEDLFDPAAREMNALPFPQKIDKFENIIYGTRFTDENDIAYINFIFELYDHLDTAYDKVIFISRLIRSHLREMDDGYNTTDYDSDIKSSAASCSLLEVGCGVGNLFYPLLEEGLSLKVHACDLSPRAIELVKQHPMFEADRINAFQTDVTSEGCFSDIGPVDIVTMVFVLSAVHPEKFTHVLNNVYSVLKPGGILFFRDYGLYDMTQIRFKPGHKIAENFYMRQDGTRSYFFSTTEVEQIFSTCGFRVVSNQYVNRRTINKKEEIDVPRIYVQAKFEKP